ncbi:sensor domain-containing diguanylate cyclase [Azoarcus sp. L1K30]|uniref:sensor domain-containing diguanylate cyclase n=1 Tax=Azoarcus sp. L1K30 TaxID=2820277 RepID=UPI0020123883|nr:sensor domain-containing diguanylate cyclase [Azoarcus sp. L1K30]
MHTPYSALDLLSTPVWIVSPSAGQITYANDAAKELSPSVELAALRHGRYSAHAEEHLLTYLPALRAREQVVEIWTVCRNEHAVPLSCKLSLLQCDGAEEEMLVEGILASLPGLSTQSSGSSSKQEDRGIFETLFHSNSAPMLLIDPAADGRIVDANLTATRFYGHSRETLCQMHTWQINALGRSVLPIMDEVAKLPGGHKPLNFVHRLADGGLRNVQTYAGPLMHQGRRLMFCIIHDVTEQKRLKDELEHAASRDPLTGLWNRRRFLQMLENAHGQKRRHDQDYSLMLLDADHFKAINDQHGHHAGDEALVLLAKVLETRVRETDAVCRWGGEEFMVLLPRTDLHDAARLAESLREIIAQTRLPLLPTITVSIGVAQHQASETTECLLKRADEALYRAKHLGRNRVELA